VIELGRGNGKPMGKVGTAEDGQTGREEVPSQVWKFSALSLISASAWSRSSSFLESRESSQSIGLADMKACVASMHTVMDSGHEMDTISSTLEESLCFRKH
jgi:hypothetical protein